MPIQNESPLMSHLIELRKRVLHYLFGLAFLIILLLPFSNYLYTFLALPLLQHLPAGQHLIATQVTSPFVVPLKLTIIVAFFVSIPLLLYQLWAFISPGLYPSERHLIWPIVVASVALFAAGIAFAYFIIFPIAFGFFVQSAPRGVVLMPDISQYLDFTARLFFAFGMAFEIPILMVALTKLRVIRYETFATVRPYMIVFNFILGMLLTPPDVLSQILLAVPMCVLYEIGVVLSKWLAIPSKEKISFNSR